MANDIDLWADIELCERYAREAKKAGNRKQKQYWRQKAYELIHKFQEQYINN